MLEILWRLYAFLSELNAEELYITLLGPMVIIGTFYMFACQFEFFSATTSKHTCTDPNNFTAKEAWIIANSPFLIFASLAVIFGETMTGRYASALLFVEILTSFEYYSSTHRHNFRHVHKGKLIYQTIRNTFFAIILNSWNAFFHIPDLLSFFAVFSYFSGTFCFIVGILIELYYHQYYLNFPYQSNESDENDLLLFLVVSPGQFGVLLKWFGYHVMCGEGVSLYFFFYKAQCAIGKAYIHHNWFKRNHPDHIGDRRIVIPFIL